MKRDTQPEGDLAQSAQEVEEHLSAVRKLLRKPVEAEFARGNLTGPQRSVMQVLYRAQGCSLKDLSRAVGLAHSTVSGIVDRLAERGLVERQTDPGDRRATIIRVSPTVTEYMQNTYPSLAIHPLKQALDRATPEDRDTILRGLRLLRRAMESGCSGEL